MLKVTDTQLLSVEDGVRSLGARLGRVSMRIGQTTGEFGQVRWRDERPSGRATFVVVMQTAEVWAPSAKGGRPMRRGREFQRQ
jgi:hypothetical protein